MIGVRAVVAQELGVVAAHVDGEVEVAVIVEVGDGQAASRNGLHEVGAQGFGHLLELALSQVAEHQLGFGILDLGVVKVDVVEHGAVHLADVRPAVVVVIHELHRDAAQENRLVADAGGVGGVVKGLVVVVVIEAVELEIEMGHVDVEPAVAVHVGGVDAHAGLVLAILAGRHAGAE